MMTKMIKIIKADTKDLIKNARGMFLEYAQSLHFDLGFQDFDKEMKDFPGCYAPPQGVLLLAVKENTPAGCVGLRSLGNGICEMKRLYVKNQFRGLGAGKSLVRAVISTGIQMNYRLMRLDTLPSMTGANHLYKQFGFTLTAPYRYNPIKGAVFMELALKKTEKT